MRYGLSYGLVNLLVTPLAASDKGWSRKKTKSRTCGSLSCWPLFQRFFFQPSTSFLSKPVTPCTKSFHPVVINLHPSSKTYLKRSGLYSLKINYTGKKPIESAHGVILPILLFRQQLGPLSKILETTDLKI
jgi:hypothetical protein